MKICQTLTPVLAFAAFSSIAHADAPKMPRALRCEFESYASGIAEPTAARITATIKQEPGIDPLTFSALDPSKGTAQFIGNIGTSNVTFISSAFAWTFIETTEPGNVNLTEVFLWNEPSADLGMYRAVHSHHSSMMGAIVVSQHYGRCKALY